jgi:hypothetical protein
MGYNPFRYYTQGKYRKRPLKSYSPLLLKIRNGDFEYSPYFLEADDNHKLYDKMYNEYIQNSYSKDEFSIKHEQVKRRKPVADPGLCIICLQVMLCLVAVTVS